MAGRLRNLLEERRRTGQEEINAHYGELAEMDAVKQLEDFIKQRSSPETYQSYRGLIGQVHTDLRELEQKLQNAHAQRMHTRSGQSHHPERVILYIDDLDRCPPPRVVEVLAAVHLMLALPLFVVVVAVDPRWLLRSVEHHYRELFMNSMGTPGFTDAENVATPLDYLDKIFQIPFVVPPTTPEKTARLINSLLEALETADSPDAEDESDGPTARPDTDAAVDSARETTERGDEAPGTYEAPEAPGGGSVQLQLEEAERDFLARVGSLTTTPRATKKLVNLYRLVRISVSPEDLPAFVGTRETPGEHQVVQILLAVLVGTPRQSKTIFQAVQEASPNTKITDVLRGTSAGSGAGERVAALIDEINESTPVTMDSSLYQKWCLRLARFSFYTRHLIR
ncbi:P-loop NTPase fold protein [Streptomyces marispadix]|uniref:KAP family NTPase n=1 Tax=Streptomyces marispadix TaxID=2922868 RepID=A0ABS9SX90_9ACTN|nr:P-loop NTPase fold protein [Streptomyces marispadix]MCH6160823.1 KAP family NTPase [Streptomyces marispadix]